MNKRNITQASAALLLMVLLAFAVYDARQEAAQAADLDRACGAERYGPPPGQDPPPLRLLACIGWSDPAEPDIHTPQG